MNLRRIGISGFMGAGKTTSCGLMAAALKDAGFAVRVIDADAEAKRIMQNDKTIHNKLAASFGKNVINDSGIVFPALASSAFSSLSHLRRLNEIVHPVLLEKLRELIFCGDKGCVICDAALIPLWPVDDWFDALFWVESPFEKRFQRLREKLRLSAGELTGRMLLQERCMPEPKKGPWKMIVNQGTFDDLRCSILSICAAVKE